MATRSENLCYVLIITRSAWIKHMMASRMEKLAKAEFGSNAALIFSLLATSSIKLNLKLRKVRDSYIMSCSSFHYFA